MTVISSWAGGTSNAYASLTAVDSILATTVIDYSAWTNATVPQREAAVVQATRDIDALQWIGTRYYYEQLLEFPRQLQEAFPWNYTTSTGSILNDVEQARMKLKVEQATALQALKLLRDGGRNIHAENQQNGIQSFSEAVGPMSMSVNYGGKAGSGGSGKAESRLSPEALSIIAEYKAMRRIYRA